jgi:hypothetical protein
LLSSREARRRGNPLTVGYYLEIATSLHFCNDRLGDSGRGENALAIVPLNRSWPTTVSLCLD